ncbi:biotin synthase [Hypoxylon sp. NC1633]|nr:biotin synthase [Hypoxylon sp. NC1633]
MESARLALPLRRLAQPLARHARCNAVRSFTSASSRASAAAVDIQPSQHPVPDPSAFPIPGPIQIPVPVPVQPEAPAQASKNVLSDAVAATQPRNNWTKEEITTIYNHPLLDLVHQAGLVHRRFHNPAEVQLCTLMNIKTGGCTEDCSYCAQATRYQSGTGLQAKRTESVSTVLAAAAAARARGSTRFCMGAAWRDMRGRRNGLREVAAMVRGVRALGMEACVTLGMIDGAQAAELAAAGLTAYNHNLDTSREFYPSVVSTRTYDERLRTLAHVREAGINVCSGGILGLGETAADRVGLLHTVSTLPSHPESFPVNALVPIKGTPLGDRPPIDFTSMLRTIATARLIMPATIVRIAAGRKTMSEEKQALCFMAGANAIFTGEKMLTTECNDWDEDKVLFDRWGLEPMRSFDKSPPPSPS